MTIETNNFHDNFIFYNENKRLYSGVEESQLPHTGELGMEISLLMQKVKSASSALEKIQWLSTLEKEVYRFHQVFPKGHSKDKFTQAGLKALSHLDKRENYEKEFPKTNFNFFEINEDLSIIRDAEGFLVEEAAKFSQTAKKMQEWESLTDSPDSLIKLIKELSSSEQNELKDLCSFLGKSPNFEIAMALVQSEPLKINLINQVITNFFLDKIFLPESSYQEIKENYGALSYYIFAWTSKILSEIYSHPPSLISSQTHQLIGQLAVLYGKSSSIAKEILDSEFHTIKWEMDPVKTRAIAQKIAHSIEHFKDSQERTLLLPLNTLKHATQLLIQLQPNGHFTVVHFNTGDGIKKYHPPLGRSGLYQTFREFKDIPLEAFTPEVLKEIIECRVDKDINQLYSALDKILLRGTPVIYKEEVFYSKPQERGTCTSHSCYALFRHQVLTLSGDPSEKLAEYQVLKAAYPNSFSKIKKSKASVKIEDLFKIKLEKMQGDLILANLAETDFEEAEKALMKALSDQSPPTSHLSIQKKYQRLLSLTNRLIDQWLTNSLDAPLQRPALSKYLWPASLEFDYNLPAIQNQLKKTLSLLDQNNFDSDKAEKFIAGVKQGIFVKFPSLQAGLLKSALKSSTVQRQHLLFDEIFNTKGEVTKLINALTPEDAALKKELFLFALSTNLASLVEMIAEWPNDGSFEAFATQLLQPVWMESNPKLVASFLKVLSGNKNPSAPLIADKIENFILSQIPLFQKVIPEVFNTLALRYCPENPDAHSLAKLTQLEGLIIPNADAWWLINILLMRGHPQYRALAEKILNHLIQEKNGSLLQNVALEIFQFKPNDSQLILGKILEYFWGNQKYDACTTLIDKALRNEFDELAFDFVDRFLDAQLLNEVQPLIYKAIGISKSYPLDPDFMPLIKKYASSINSDSLKLQELITTCKKSSQAYIDLADQL